MVCGHSNTSALKGTGYNTFMYVWLVYTDVMEHNYEITLTGPSGYITVEQENISDATWCAKNLLEATNEHHSVNIEKIRP